MNLSPYDATRSPEAVAEAQRSVMMRVYGWMTLGLTVTAAAAFYTLSNERLLNAVLGNIWVFIGLMAIEIALVMVLSARLMKLTVNGARLAFLAYAALNGVTLSFLMLVYTAASVAQVFALTAGLFGVMAVYGYVTKTDLTRWGNLLMMGVLGLIGALVINMFLRNNAFDLIISVIGVIVFVGLTAYDSQKIKRMAAAVDPESEMGHKVSIMGALTVYLDFINMFLWLLRLFGRRR
jgi:FtsH-binding integral membrane protein